MDFAARLRQERLRRHLSQETLAEALGVSARTISRWEQGRGIPQAILRVQLSRYFELSSDVFFEESEMLASPLREEAEEPGEAFSHAAPALPENDLREHAASVSISQEMKVSGRSTSRQPFSRRNILLGLGVFGLIVLVIGEFFAVFHSLAALSAPALKGAEPHVTPVIAASPPVPIRLTRVSKSDNRGRYICWGVHVHLPAQCMDLKNDRFSANQPISLWSSLSGNGLGWDVSIRGKVTSTWPFTVPILNTKYHGDTVVYFEKTSGTGHNGCIGVHLNIGLAWELCGHPDTYWVISTYGFLVNVSHSNSGGLPAAAGVCDSRNGSSIGLGFETKPNQCLGPWTLIS